MLIPCQEDLVSHSGTVKGLSSVNSNVIAYLVKFVVIVKGQGVL